MSTQQLSAIERASRRWWNVELPEVEEAKHERLMNALRRIDPKLVRITHEPWRPGAKWRYLRHEYENQRRQRTCSMCKQTGELTVSDGYGCIEVDLCPKCQRSNPYRRFESRDVSAF